jgi:hypothetical protein
MQSGSPTEFPDSKSRPVRKPLPIYERAAIPPPHDFNERDQSIIRMIYAFDGILADYQIERLFFHSHARMKARMSKLFHNGYVARLNRAQRAQLPYMVYCLDKRGVDFIANLEGVALRELHWRTPWEGWSLVRHDIELNDIRLSIMGAIKGLAQANLVQWTTAQQFAMHASRVIYTDSKGTRRVRQVQPDGYFHIVNRAHFGERHSRFFLERDRRTEANPRFFEEKVLAGLAYLQSEGYKERFGDYPARWLTVTTGERRVANMKAHIERKAARMGINAKAFYFTTFEKALTPRHFSPNQFGCRSDKITP